jgi:hypothetical protein
VMLVEEHPCHFGKSWGALGAAIRRLNGALVRYNDRKPSKRKLLKVLPYVPRILMTDKLQSYGATKTELLPGVAHRQQRGLTNRAEHAHRPARERGRHRRFTSPASTQPFLPVQAIIGPHFRPGRHRWRATVDRRQRTRRFAPWQTARGRAAETPSAASLPSAQLARECLTNS